MSQDCVFCKIVAGEIPAEKVYEDPDALAFVDINPLAPGHTLLVPKRHYERVGDAPPDVMAAVGKALPEVSRGVAAATEAEGLNVFISDGRVAGQVIPHVHVHVVPRRAGDGVKLRWAPGSYGEGELAKVAASIRSALSGKGES